jgi:FMN-dependent NADH-azoreductase
VKLLEIQSSPRGDFSDSIALTTSFIEACKSANASIVVDALNVWHEGLPEFDHEAIGAKYKAVKRETMTEARQSSSIRAVHVSWKVRLYRRRDSITKRPIWTLGCGSSVFEIFGA